VKVILVQEVPHLGQVGDVKEVSHGYARNFLLPRKLAIEATTGNIKQWEQRKRTVQRQADQARTTATSLAGKLAQVSVRVPVRVGEMGRLFGSVTAQDIANRMKNELGLEIDRHKIVLERPIKDTGEHEVTIKLHHDVTAQFKFEVKSAEAKAEEAKGEQPQKKHRSFFRRHKEEKKEKE
jgi:large subunit ribosomal protein L9